MIEIPKYADAPTAARLVSSLGEQYAIVENPSYVYSPYDIYPLAPPRQQLDDGLLGAVMDMDGTTTTTEPLCVHSLETMVRRIGGYEQKSGWRGLDHQRDYPNIIGNSTTRHVEYLVQTYRQQVRLESVREWHVYAAAWTLGKAADEGRKTEVRANLAALGAGELLGDARFLALMQAKSLDGPEERIVLRQIADELAPRYQLEPFTNLVRAAIDIYYQRYHFILGRIAAGEGQAIAEAVLGGKDKHLIEPMPGIGVFLALLKGWLGQEAAACFEILAQSARATLGSAELDTGRAALPALGVCFERQPARVAVVTSSIAYEAEIVLGEVFRILREQAAGWALSPARLQRILAGFASPRHYYDGFITASDSSEMRLKPHRDLYSLALHRIGILPPDFHRVVGFEDSESGTIAIRAAGISICCALPFTLTKDHRFQAATHQCPGGIPEVILKHRVFLPQTHNFAPQTLGAFEA
jgi:beta-phosphoglucomutase-like phosphatase (HAD superfamily)